ncbi:MAG: hypothetical protein AAFY71_20910 [Bacteroidota bacterium]
MFSLQVSFGQSLPEEGDQVKITKRNGAVILGEFLSDDGREVLVLTEDLGKVYIPKHEIEKIEPLKADDFRNGNFVGDDPFSTRYFITTNGLPIKKGDNYGMLSIYGPEAHFSVADNFNVGFMTSWAATPAILSMKYSTQIEEKVHFGVGALVGVNPFFFPGYGGLAFGSLTLGDRKGNITFTGGYAGVSSMDGTSGGHAPLASIAGMIRTNSRLSLVFDSFIYLGGSAEGSADDFALVMPGLRFNTSDKFALQFGLGGVVAQGTWVPLPIPVGSIFFALN